MPRSELHIELDGPSDYFEILKGEEFRDSKAEIKTEGNRLIVVMESKTPKALITALSSLMKQIRIIEQTSEVLKK